MSNAMRMFPVEGSSTIAAWGYLLERHAACGTLRIRFRSGGVYDCPGVTAEVLDAFLNAPSMGSYHARAIKGQFEALRVQPLEDEPVSTAPVPALMDVVACALEDGAGPPGDRWTAFDTDAHRPGSATDLPVDVPRGRRVRIMAMMVEVTEGDVPEPPLAREDGSGPIVTAPPPSQARVTSAQHPVKIVRRGDRRRLGA